jgi:nucleoid-associated protein YgaU
MNRQHPARRDPSRWHFFGACTWALVCSSFLFTPLTATAQDPDVAEAARQEKARKAAQPQKQPAHVYTNEDLQRSQILAPEDRASIEARKKNSAPPIINAPLPSNAPVDGSTAAESLGEIARRARQEKAARQAEQAGKIPAPPPYHLESPQPREFAHPKSLGRPLVAPTSPSRKTFQPPLSAEPHKHDPFSRATFSPAPSRSLPVPVIAPKVPRTAVHAPPIVAKTQPDTSHVRIEPGDSLWNLSRHYLGRGSRWHVWLESNPAIGDPHRLQPGTALIVPRSTNRHEAHADNTVAAAASVAPSPPGGQPPGTVSVEPGDSLWKLAAQHLGHSADWPCLAHANPDLRDPSLIYPGQILRLPNTCPQSQLSSPIQ